MTDVYVLELGITAGVFTTPEKAMEYLYYSDVLQINRGYMRHLEPIIWVNDSGLHWYGYYASQYRKPFFDRKQCATIRRMTIDSKFLAPEVMVYSVPEDLPTIQERNQVISWADDRAAYPPLRDKQP